MAKKQDLKPDTILKNYWNDNSQFADLFNAVLFDGKQVIRPEEPENEDTEMSSVLEHRDYAESIRASRDSIKVSRKSTAYGVELVLLGLESQEHIHYAMPLRLMDYDYGAYRKQYDGNAAKYKKPDGKQSCVELTLENFLNFLDDHCISVFTAENQMSVYQLYGNLYHNFPIKDKEMLESGQPRRSDFMDDYYKITADLYHHQCNFLGYKVDDDYSDYTQVKEMLEREKDLVSSPKEYRKNYYSLFNMTAAGFFFIGKPVNGAVTIGTFDKCNNMYLKKIYDNIICIYLMLERYLGFYPEITLQIYMSDADRIISLQEKEMEQGFNHSRQEKQGFTKKECFFQNMSIPRQNWDDIHVDYIYYPLREKYNL